MGRGGVGEGMFLRATESEIGISRSNLTLMTTWEPSGRLISTSTTVGRAGEVGREKRMGGDGEMNVEYASAVLCITSQ